MLLPWEHCKYWLAVLLIPRSISLSAKNWFFLQPRIRVLNQQKRLQPTRSGRFFFQLSLCKEELTTAEDIEAQWMERLICHKSSHHGMFQVKESTNINKTRWYHWFMCDTHFKMIGMKASCVFCCCQLTHLEQKCAVSSLWMTTCQGNVTGLSVWDYAGMTGRMSSWLPESKRFYECEETHCVIHRKQLAGQKMSPELTVYEIISKLSLISKLQTLNLKPNQSVLKCVYTAQRKGLAVPFLLIRERSLKDDRSGIICHCLLQKLATYVT